MIHAKTHPTLDVEGCYACKLASFRVAPSATPTRRGGAEAKANGDREKRWTRDHAAYRRLWSEGLSPHRLDGAADLERDARGKADIEMFMGASSLVEEVPDDAA